MTILTNVSWPFWHQQQEILQQSWAAIPAACSMEIIRNREKKKKPGTLQDKSIDFYGTGEIDEGMCARNVDTDELLGAGWIFTTPDKITTPDSPLSIPCRRNWWGEEKKKNPMVKMKR